MPWYSPPTRREVSLVLFSLTTFIVFYNLETSFTSSSLSGDWTSLQGAHSTDAQEDWDNSIYGNWSWEEEKVAENAQKFAVGSGSGASTVLFQPQIFGTVGVNDGTLDWNDNIPTTRVLRHVPGYTIMDNVFMLNGTVFIVTDDPSFPPLDSIASSSENSDWQILSKSQAREALGAFGGLIHGVSWLVTDASPSNYTLLSLWRTYSALQKSISPDAMTLPPPRRIFYPNLYTFKEQLPKPTENSALRPRSAGGFHPFLIKAAFPTLGLMYKEDWDDYALMHVPFLMKRVVVADHGAAHRAKADVPSFAVPLLELVGPKKWWEPIRLSVARFLGVPEQAPKKAWLSKTQTIVTYLSRQDAAHGPKLREADHQALIKSLGELGEMFTVHIVPSEAPWVERMSAIAQSTVVIGVYGDHMADSIYMPPSSRTTVMEIFPPGIFVRDAEVSAKALDMHYFAWWGAQKYGVKALPPVVIPSEGENNEIPIDVPAITQAIRRVA